MDADSIEKNLKETTHPSKADITVSSSVNLLILRKLLSHSSVQAINQQWRRIARVSHQALQGNLKIWDCVGNDVQHEADSPFKLTAESMLSEKRRSLTVATGVYPAGAQVVSVQ